MTEEQKQMYELLMDSAIEDALEQFRQVHPDYAADCRKEDRLFETLNRFFKSGNPSDAADPAYYHMMKEYFNLINNKIYTEMKVMYLRGYFDCTRLACNFGWLPCDLQP